MSLSILGVFSRRRQQMTLYCKVCRRNTRHRYIGTQRFPGKAFPLYDCEVCHNTTTPKGAA